MKMPDGNAYEGDDKEAVRKLGDQIGYGRMMHLAEAMWREKQLASGGTAGAEFTVGPCATYMRKCPHPFRNQRGNCQVCCESGRITEWVAKVFAASGP